MSSRLWIGVIAAVLSCLLSFPSARADEVRLKNGDRYSGKIIRIEKERLTLETEALEKRLEINWEHVECVTSEKEITLVLQDDEVWIGRITCPRPGMFQLHNEKMGWTKELPLSELKAVNPAVYKGYFNLGGNYTDGNTNTSAVNLATRLEIRTRKHRFTADAKYNYGEKDGTTAVRNGTGFLKYDLFLTDRVYSYAQTLLERDDFANLNLRATQGLGLGYQFYDTRRTNFYIEAGISYYNEDVMVGDDKSGASGRWGANLEHEIVDGKLKVFHRQEGYYNFNTTSFYLRTEQGLRVPFWKDFTGFFQADWRYNSEPEDGKKKSDTFIILGLSYEYAYW